MAWRESRLPGVLRRIALALFLVYEIADFGDPLMPGAVNFNDDETVYSATAEYGAARVVVAPDHIEHLRSSSSGRAPPHPLTASRR